MIFLHLFPARKTKAAHSTSSVIAFFLLSYICLFLGQFLIFVLISPHVPMLAETLALFGTALVFLPLFVFSRMQKATMADLLLLRRKKAVSFSVLGWLCGLFFVILLLGSLLAFRACAYERSDIGSIPRILLLLFVFLVQGSAEELLFRGFLMSSLSARYGGVASALVSSFAFSLVHATNPGVNLVGLLNVFLFGLLFSSVTQCTGSIFFACGMHAGWNFAQSLLGFYVSGNASLYPLFLFSIRKSVLMGAAFGMEGSPLLTALLVCILAFLAAGLSLRNKKLADW